MQELNLQISARFSKGGTNFDSPLGSLYIDVSGSVAVKNTVSVGTVDETLDKGDIGTVGFLIGKNLDPTNFILIGDGTNYLNKVKAGEPICTRWNGANVHAKADTAACLFEYMLVSD